MHIPMQYVMHAVMQHESQIIITVAHVTINNYLMHKEMYTRVNIISAHVQNLLNLSHDCVTKHQLGYRVLHD